MTSARQPLTPAQAARAAAVIARLAKLWPACFAVYQQQRRPLAIGIDKLLLLQMAPAIKLGRISETDIRQALRRYTGASGYLRHCAIINNPRIGLDGQPVGPAVSERDAIRARRLLAVRRQRKLAQAVSEQIDAVKVGTKRIGRAEDESARPETEIACEVR